ncbi:MAG TPA: 6-carboxytetrahydropterin synthase, partial [Abditibacteriaceae bacterium]
MQLPQARVSICRRAFFTCGRRLRHPDWSDARNREAFGPDALPHGHDYVLDVFYSGPVNTHDGMIVNLTDMKPVIAQAIDPLDGKWLDEDVEHFRAHRPTVENLVNFVWNALPAQMGSGTLARISLSESRRVCVTKDAHSMKITRKYEFAAAHRLH